MTRLKRENRTMPVSPFRSDKDEPIIPISPKSWSGSPASPGVNWTKLVMEFGTVFVTAFDPSGPLIAGTGAKAFLRLADLRNAAGCVPLTATRKLKIKVGRTTFSYITVEVRQGGIFLLDVDASEFTDPERIKAVYRGSYDFRFSLLRTLGSQSELHSFWHIPVRVENSYSVFEGTQSIIEGWIQEIPPRSVHAQHLTTGSFSSDTPIRALTDTTWEFELKSFKLAFPFYT